MVSPVSELNLGLQGYNLGIEQGNNVNYFVNWVVGDDFKKIEFDKNFNTILNQNNIQPPTDINAKIKTLNSFEDKIYFGGNGISNPNIFKIGLINPNSSVSTSVVPYQIDGLQLLSKNIELSLITVGLNSKRMIILEDSMVV